MAVVIYTTAQEYLRDISELENLGQSIEVLDQNTLLKDIKTLFGLQEEKNG